MKMPLCRIRQVLELIMQERREEYKFRTQLVEWQTKQLASMFTVVAREQKQVKAIQKAVKEMTLPLSDEESDIKTKRTIKTVDGEVLPTSNNVEENDAVNYIDFDDQPGFETLMSAFGDMIADAN